MGLFDFLFKKKSKDAEPALGVTSEMCAAPKAKKHPSQIKKKTEPAPVAEGVAVEELASTSAELTSESAEPAEIDEASLEVVDEQSFDEEEPAGGGRKRVGTFNVKRAKDGRYVFNLYAANKVMVATSQIYSSSQSAMTGVKSVMANAANAPIEDSTLKNPTVYPFPKWEVYMDRAGEYRFRLYATNGNCICHAKKGYSTKSNCKRGIESIIRFVSEANIDKSYLAK